MDIVESDEFKTSSCPALRTGGVDADVREAAEGYVGMRSGYSMDVGIYSGFVQFPSSEEDGDGVIVAMFV